jgi:HTH-type transcriptional regulator / antitoxin HipB
LDFDGIEHVPYLLFLCWQFGRDTYSRLGEEGPEDATRRNRTRGSIQARVFVAEEMSMSDLRVYIDGRKKRDPEFAENYDKGLQDFKLGVMLRQAREDAGLTQEELARKISTKKTAISRIENHAEDMKLSTLEKFANALGKQLTISVA